MRDKLPHEFLTTENLIELVEEADEIFHDRRHDHIWTKSSDVCAGDFPRRCENREGCAERIDEVYQKLVVEIKLHRIFRICIGFNTSRVSNQETTTEKILRLEMRKRSPKAAEPSATRKQRKKELIAVKKAASISENSKRADEFEEMSREIHIEQTSRGSIPAELLLRFIVRDARLLAAISQHSGVNVLRFLDDCAGEGNLHVFSQNDFATRFNSTPEFLEDFTPQALQKKSHLAKKSLLKCTAVNATWWEKSFDPKYFCNQGSSAGQARGFGGSVDTGCEVMGEGNCVLQ
jgi:hypothetical protein